MRFRFFIAVAVLLLSAAESFAQAIPDKPFPERLVNDFAGVFPAFQADSLEQVLVAFDDSTSNQITVVTVKSLDGYDVAQYALRLGNKWGVGSSRNNGIVILLKSRGSNPYDGYIDVTIQTGFGLEGAIPDAYASRIIRNVMGPHLSKDEYFEAVCGACDELMALASGEINEPRGDDYGSDYIIAIFSLILIIVFIIAIIDAGKNGRRGGGNHSGGGNHGYGRTIFINPGGFGGGSFGGGFGGGFGGFGGGSFGGGGASGRF